MKVKIVYNTEGTCEVTEEQEAKVEEFVSKLFGVTRWASGMELETGDRDMCFDDKTMGEKK